MQATTPLLAGRCSSVFALVQEQRRRRLDHVPHAAGARARACHSVPCCRLAPAAVNRCCPHLGFKHSFEGQTLIHQLTSASCGSSRVIPAVSVKPKPAAPPAARARAASALCRRRPAAPRARRRHRVERARLARNVACRRLACCSERLGLLSVPVFVCAAQHSASHYREALAVCGARISSCVRAPHLSMRAFSSATMRRWPSSCSRA